MAANDIGGVPVTCVMARGKGYSTTVWASGSLHTLQLRCFCRNTLLFTFPSPSHPPPTQLTALGNPIAPNAAVHPNSGIITPQVKEKKPHIKKPLNAFMLFMKEKRADVIKECTLKESAAINQILGKMVRKEERVEEGSYKVVSRPS